MRTRKILSIALAAMLLAALCGCGAKAPQPAAQAPADRDCLYQTALLQSLMLGDYYGSVPVGRLKACGDTGIGTFDGLNGELIMLDGTVYAALSDGSVAVMPDDMTVPFSNVTFLEEDTKETLTDIGSMEELKQVMTGIVSRQGSNYFYMAKITGTFAAIQYRSEYAQTEPYKPLAEVMLTDQVIFEGEGLSGTIVALYCPDYMDGLNTSGWHFHFLSEDKTRGGHLLDVRFDTAEAVIDKTTAFQMLLPEEEFFQDIDLTADLEAAINKVEKNS